MLSLTAPPDPSRLRRVRERIRDYLRYHCFALDDIDDIVLAIDEACANAIRHGHCSDELEISLEFDDHGLAVRVRDRGVGFDSTRIDRRHLPDPSQTGGRGLFLMQQLMDDLELSGQDGTEVLMRKRLTCTSPGETVAGVSGAARVPGQLEARLFDALEGLSEGFVAIDWEWRFIYVNPAASEAVQRPAHSLIGVSVWDLLGESAPGGLESTLRAAMEDGEASRSDVHDPRQDRWFELKIHPASFGVSAYFSDVTDRKRMEQEREQLLEALDEERRRLGFVMEQSRAGLAYLDSGFTVLRVNGRFAEYNGLDREELLDRRLFDVVPNTEVERLFEQVRTRGKRLDLSAMPCEYALQPWRGTLYYDWSLAPLHDDAGDLRGFVLSVIDVTRQTVDGRFSAAQNRIRAALASTLDSTRILQAIVELAGEAMGCEASNVALRREDYWEAVSGWNMPPSFAGQRFLPEQAPYAEIALLERRPVPVGDYGADPLTDKGVWETWGFEATLAVPLIVPGSVLGCLFFTYFTSSHMFSEPEIEFGMRCAEAVWSALQNARLYEAERRSGAILQRVLSIAPVMQTAGTVREVVDEICVTGHEMFDCDSVSFYAVRDPELILLARLPQTPVAPVGAVYAIADVPGLAADLMGQGPSFVANALEADLSETHHEVVRHLGLVSTLRLPVAAGSRAVGLIVLGWGEEEPPPDEIMLAAARRFADQAGLAWENAERRETQAEIARLHDRLEASLLPRTPFRHAALDVTSAYRPGEARLRLGGDFFDVLPCNRGQLAVLIGDVCGHGPDAAALGALMRGNWRALNLSGAGLQTLLNTLETVLVLERWAPEVFITMIGGWIDPDRGSFRYFNAGHPPPLLIGPDGVEQLTHQPELPLGLREMPEPWQAHEVTLQPGWALLLYTDGLVEGRAEPHSRQRFGITRLVELVAAHAAGDDLDELPERLLSEAERAHGQPLPDDAAALLVRVRA